MQSPQKVIAETFGSIDDEIRYQLLTEVHSETLAQHYLVNNSSSSNNTSSTTPLPTTSYSFTPFSRSNSNPTPSNPHPNTSLPPSTTTTATPNHLSLPSSTLLDYCSLTPSPPLASTTDDNNNNTNHHLPATPRNSSLSSSFDTNAASLPHASNSLNQQTSKSFIKKIASKLSGHSRSASVDNKSHPHQHALDSNSNPTAFDTNNAHRRGVILVSCSDSVVLLESPIISKKNLKIIALLKVRPGGITSIASRFESGLLSILIGCSKVGELWLFTLSFSPNNAQQQQQNVQTVFNRDGMITNSRIVYVKWISMNRILCVHSNGMMIVYDTKLKQTTNLNNQSLGNNENNDQSINSNTTQQGSTALHPHADSAAESTAHSGQGFVPTSSASVQQFNGDRASGSSGSNSSVLMNVWRNGKGRRTNPVLAMNIGAGILCADLIIVPSTPSATEHNKSNTNSHPNTVYIALSCDDGYIRVIDVTNEVLVVAFRSFYGCFLTVKWIPSSSSTSNSELCLIGGGEDDALCVFSVTHKTQIARLEGHSSYISSVAFTQSLHSASTVNLVSAAQDCRILFWQFNLNNSATPNNTNTNAFLTIPPKQRSHLVIVSPIISHYAHREPLTSVLYSCDGSIITADWTGTVKVWNPLKNPPPLDLFLD
eukprot:CAMPEP_0182445328 /NCGR_PEP_ID=MMETSP1172-20130603/3490_1 /TAXON_ID=708627 /ORGANISM="Timspurckia oligopyrenoides, Strain CCMP3278" /LENGTH=653 /DNA_ID=CAMNT_0024641077 /DNA_START=66 /DNA_END=2027 /DNA_ORIENTATION=+